MLTVFSSHIDANVESEMQSDLEEIRQNAILILNMEIETVILYLKNQAKTYSVLGAMTEKEIIEVLKSFPNPQFMPRVNIMNMDGYLYSSLDGSVKKYNPNDYAEALNRKDYGISKPRYSMTLKRTIIEIATPLYINGERFGILIGNYDIKNFETLFMNNFMQGNCAICMATSNGTILSRSGALKYPSNFKDNLFNFYYRDDVNFTKGSADIIKQDLMNKKSGYIIYTNENKTRYVSYAPVGINDWFIAAAADKGTLAEHSNIIKTYASRLVIGVVTSMVILLIIIILFRTKEQHIQQAELKKLASLDSLTQLLNKTTTEYEIDNFIKLEGLTGQHALFMIDIDGFKNVNDILGHTKGDEFLVEFANKLKNIFKVNDIVGRVGGDEFIVFIKDFENVDTITQKAKEICKESTHYLVKNKEIHVETTASVGIALYSANGKSFNELYHNADIALYKSKKSGKNCVSFYEKENDK